MKKLTFLFLALIFILTASPLALLVVPAQAADSSACYNISDGDARSYCLAKARREVSACYSIQNASMRSQCLAEVR